MQILPYPFVRPVADILFGRDLQIQPRDFRRAHAIERESALMVGVDQLVMGGRRGGQDAEPGERIRALERGEHAGGNRTPAHALKTVAAGDNVARELDLLAASNEHHLWRARIDVGDSDIADLEHDLATGVDACADQVPDDLLLPVDRDAAATGQRGHVDAMPLAAEAKLDPVVNQALALQPRADTGIIQQIDAALFQHTCPNAMLDIVASTILDHRRFDPLPLP